ncbi:TIGR03086 family metal-binding protein [Streptosporangium longisporum]
MNEIEMLESATARTVALARGVRDDQLSLPTPCEDYDVGALLEHLSWVSAMFAALPRGERPPPQDADRDAFAARAAGMLAAWAEPGATEGISAGMGLPMSVVLRMAVNDMVMHGWDLARATGQEFTVDAGTGELLAAFVAQMAPQGRPRGVFGEEVPVPADASPFERALGLAGRDPGWRP